MCRYVYQYILRVVSTVGVMSQAMKSSGIMKLANSQYMIIDNCGS